MTYTVSKLISNAYYISGIVSREFQTVSGSQLFDGLDMLNDILADKTVENDMIPYYLKYNFNAIADTETYFIPNLIEAETLVFYIGSVRYQMSEVDRNQYFGASRANDIKSLPFNWHLERCLGGANLSLYFKPDTAYPMELWGQFRLADVSDSQDLSLTLDRFYINYLKYALALRICTEFNYIVPPGVEQQLFKYKQMISKSSGRLDLKMQKTSTFSAVAGPDYAQANLGHGWTA